MSVNQSNSPDDHKFSARKPTFDLSALSGEWHRGSAFLTAWENAFSMLFPLGEQSFINSVNLFKDQIDDPKLLKEISDFQEQEAVHRMQHLKYNRLLCKLRGYDLKEIEAPLRTRIAWFRENISERRRLAGTVAAEHLTAILADDLLRHKDHFKGSDENIAKIWKWHAVEETEHKAVAFDVHVAVGGTIQERRHALLLTTFYIHKDILTIVCLMLKQDGKLWNLREWFNGFVFLFIKPGVFRRILFSWLAFLRKDFHPWKKDNRHLIGEWETESFPQY